MTAVIDPASASRMVFTTHAYEEWALDAIAAAACGEPLPQPIPVPPPVDWVYFIQAGDGGPIKIGYSNNPRHRFITLQTGSPFRHHYLGNVPGGRPVERDLQARFRHTHINGEWYEPSTELLDYIEANRYRYLTAEAVAR